MIENKRIEDSNNFCKNLEKKIFTEFSKETPSELGKTNLGNLYPQFIDYPKFKELNDTIVGIYSVSEKILNNFTLNSTYITEPVYKITFSDCIFQISLSIGNSIEPLELSFINCVFEGSINIDFQEFKKIKSFNDIEIIPILKFNNCHFKEDFTTTTFYWKSNLEILNNCVFHKNFQFTKNETNPELKITFSDSYFAENLNLSNQIFEKEVIIEKCEFAKSVDVSDSTFLQRVCFNESIFRQQLEFKNTNFKDKTTLQKAFFNSKLKLDNTKFEKLADFWYATFTKETHFYKVDFNGKVVFSGCYFLENVLFSYSSFNDYTFFRNTFIKKGIDLSLSIHDYKFNFFGLEHELYCETEADIDIEKINEEIIKNKSSEFMEIAKQNKFSLAIEEQIENCIISDSNLKETYRIIKYQSINSKDFTDTLKYTKYEFKTHQKAILRDQNCLKYNNIWDSIILFSNRISNDFGNSFCRGRVCKLNSVF